MKFKLGCDPELFLFDGLEYVSAYGKFPGTKKEPHKLNKGAVQVDGMALEFNIDPAETAQEFSDNIEEVKEQITRMVADVDPKLVMVFTPFARFEEKYFHVQPVECKILGCDPDYGKDGQQKVPNPELMNRPFRTAAGHLHIGWTEGQDPMEASHFEDCRFIANLFENVKGFVPETPDELERTKYYGAPPSFRPKPYGVELRSPSNLWVQSPKSHKRMFKTVQRVMESLG